MRPTSILLAKSIGLLSLAGLAVALAACGGDPAAAEEDSAAKAEAARVRLEQCLRRNGVEVRSTDGGRGSLVRIEKGKADAAMQKCRKFQEEAFGSITPQQRQEFEDAFTTFAACMREHGVDVPDPKLGDGRGGGSEVRRGPVTRSPGIDRESPKTQAAMKACQDKLPDRGTGGAGFRIGGPPGSKR